jgi:hypothetical protein
MARGCLALLASILSLASCGSGPSVTAYMSIDTGERKRTTFYTDSENINCIAEFTGAKDGLTVFATVRQTGTVDGKGESIVFQIGELPADKNTKSLVFSLAHAGNPNIVSPDDADPWPPGTFECEIAVDGVQKATAPFTIAIPKCPVYPAAQGYRCQGFYPTGSQCPSADANVSCTCSGDSGTWVCGGS